MNGDIKFEEKIEIIDELISKRRGRWKLGSLNYMDYDDVSQMLRIHISEKWHLWDQNKPLEQWVNTVITNRMINICRDNYQRLAPPCSGCSYDMGDSYCRFTPSGNKCEECPLYHKWKKKHKKDGYNLKLASSIDSEDYVESSHPSKSKEDSLFDIELSENKLHQEMKKRLSDSDYCFYEAIVIKNKTVDELKKIFPDQNMSQKKVSILNKKFLNIAKVILENKDVII